MVSGQSHVPAVLSPGKYPGVLRIRSWVGHRVGLGILDKSLFSQNTRTQAEFWTSIYSRRTREHRLSFGQVSILAEHENTDWFLDKSLFSQNTRTQTEFWTNLYSCRRREHRLSFGQVSILTEHENTDWVLDKSLFSQNTRTQAEFWTSLYSRRTREHRLSSG